jgi:hypothetical protein
VMFGLGWGLEPRTAGNRRGPEYMSIGEIADESPVGCLAPGGVDDVSGDCW